MNKHCTPLAAQTYSGICDKDDVSDLPWWRLAQIILSVLTLPFVLFKDSGVIE